MRATWADCRHGVRLLAGSPAFAAAAVLSLALGIGATTAIFSAADALLLRPLPFRDAGRIAIIWQRSPGLNVTQDWLSPGQYLDIAAEAKSFSSVAAAINTSFNLTGTDNDRPERVDGVRASSSLFTVFGARAELGRLLDATDDTPGGEQGVILTDAFWRARFGGDSAVLGRMLLLNGQPFPIVGVLAPGFAFDREVMPTVNTIGRVNFILPLPFPASARTQRHHEDFDVFVKLRPGVTRTSAQAELDGIAARMKAEYPKMYPPNGELTLSAVPLLDQVVGDARLALYVLLGASGLLLLIACGNVANLLLARAEARERDVAVRAAVGASRGRIVRQLLGESLVLAGAGGIIGIALAFAGVHMIRAVGSGTVPRVRAIAMDGRVLAFAVLVSVLTAVVFGLVPALRSARVDPQTVLKEGGRGADGGHARLRATLVAAEVALSVMLLLGAGLLVRSYGRVLDADPGFNPRGALSFRLSLPRFRYGTPDAVNTFYRQLTERLGALPGVVQVGTNYQLPFSSVSLAWEPIDVQGYVPPSPADDRIITSSAYIGGAYFRAMGMSLLAGRTFTDRDTPQSPPVVVVDDNFVRRFWPTQDPIGKRIRQNDTGRWCTVVGVVANTRQWTPIAQPPITVYFAVAQYGIASQFVVVRTASTIDPATLAPAVLGQVHALDPQLPAYDVATMQSRLHEALARRRLAMGLLAAFAGFALALSGIGTYGIIAYWVNRRRREIGIRMALGAGHAQVLGLIGRELLMMVGAGLVAGVAGALLLSRLMSGMLFGVAPTDAVTFAAVPLIMLAVALLAAFLPARRAVRVEPSTALRYE